MVEGRRPQVSPHSSADFSVSSDYALAMNASFCRTTSSTPIGRGFTSRLILGKVGMTGNRCVGAHDRKVGVVQGLFTLGAGRGQGANRPTQGGPHCPDVRHAI